METIEVVKPDLRNLKPLAKPSSVSTVNLFNDQWEWLNERASATGMSRSDLVRQAVAMLRSSVEKNVNGAARGASI